MNRNLINNYRMGGYLLIAIGLINLRYQSGESAVVGKSLTIMIPGIILLVSTWIAGVKKVLELPLAKLMIFVLGIALIAYAGIN